MNETTQPSRQELPRYKCHKVVQALQIKAVLADRLIPVDPAFDPLTVTQTWLKKHEPQAGGYFVLYDDGYESFSPAQAFESGYSLIRDDHA